MVAGGERVVFRGERRRPGAPDRAVDEHAADRVGSAADDPAPSDEALGAAARAPGRSPSDSTLSPTPVTNATTPASPIAP